MGIFFRSLDHAFEIILLFQWYVPNNSYTAEGACMGFLISHAYFFLLSLYFKNWWIHLHSQARPDGVIRNKILHSILKRIISAPIPCKQLSSEERGKAFKIQPSHTGLSEVKMVENTSWKRALSCICLIVFYWDLGVPHLPVGSFWDAGDPVAWDAQITAVSILFFIKKPLHLSSD